MTALDLQELHCTILFPIFLIAVLNLYSFTLHAQVSGAANILERGS